LSSDPGLPQTTMPSTEAIYLSHSPPSIPSPTQG
jgi:hypothetical protein